MLPSRKEVLFLKFLLVCDLNQRKAVLETLTRKQVDFLSTVLHNLLRSNIVLSDNHRRKLTRHAALIRKLASSKVAFSEKKQLYQNRSKLVAIIFRPLLPVLREYFCDGQ